MRRRVGLLFDALRAVDAPLHAVVDGARFEDLPGALLRAGLDHRCLYLDRGDNHPERLPTAPRLVGPLAADDLERLAELLGGGAGAAAAVFWRCAAGAEVLFRHLRQINMVLVPASRLPSRARPGGSRPVQEMAGDGDGDERQWLLFRHADANVMAQVVPSLAPDKFNAVLGPAEAIYFLPDDDWDARGRVLAATTRLGHGRARLPLKLDERDLDGAADRRADRSAARIGDYLRDYAPDLAERHGEAGLRRIVAASMKDGAELGLVSEAAHGRWAYLHLVSDGRLCADQGIRRYVGEPNGRSPDEKSSLLLRSMMIAAGTGRRAP